MAKLAGLKLCEAYRRQHNANFVTGIPVPGPDPLPKPHPPRRGKSLNFAL